MASQKRYSILGQFLLFTATISYGVSFVILKDVIENMPTFYTIAIRFIISSVILCVIFFKRLRKIKKSEVIHGIILGLFLSCAYITQTLGLSFTTPSQNAFLTSSYCVMCPFLVWILFKKKPSIIRVICSCVCLLGIGLIFLSGSNTENAKDVILGDGLTLIGALFFGFQIVYTDKFQREGDDAFKILPIQMSTCAVIFILITLCYEFPTGGVEIFRIPTEFIWQILFLSVVTTCYAQLAQMIGQKYTTSTKAAIILGTEALFATLTSIILGIESFTVMTVIGFVLILGAVICSEIKPNSIKIGGNKVNMPKK